MSCIERSKVLGEQLFVHDCTRPASQRHSRKGESLFDFSSLN